MRSYGIEPAAESLPPAPKSEDRDLTHVVSKLVKLHPPNPHHEIEFHEVIAACNFYDLDDVPESVDRVIDIIHEINLSRANPTETKTDMFGTAIPKGVLVN